MFVMAESARWMSRNDHVRRRFEVGTINFFKPCLSFLNDLHAAARSLPFSEIVLRPGS
jgi:hypothetical protein